MTSGKCRVCGVDISTEAFTCPKCEEKGNAHAKLFGVLAILVFAIAVVTVVVTIVLHKIGGSVAQAPAPRPVTVPTIVQLAPKTEDCHLFGTFDEWKRVIAGWEKVDHDPPAQMTVESARSQLACISQSAPEFSEARVMMDRLTVLEKSLQARQASWDALPASRHRELQASAPAEPGSQWSYSQDEDAMSKGTTYEALVVSSNTVNFDFPYSGLQHATLKLKLHPRYGKQIIFRIERGQFLCPSYDGCTVLVRFDDEQATNYSAVGPADNSTETIFIRNYSRFVEKMSKSKHMRISGNIYQQGAPVFEFDVSGFSQQRYKPRK